MSIYTHRIIFFLLIFIVLNVIFNYVIAGETRGNFSISAEVVCNCPVNGVIVPITEGVCVTECKKLQNNNHYDNVTVEVNGDVKTVTY